jgi:hypothetical protein
MQFHYVQRLTFRLWDLLLLGMVRRNISRRVAMADLRLQSGPQVTGSEDKEGSMECKVKWTGDGMSFVAETGSNHTLVMDGAPEAGGRNLAPRPMELLLAGTGGCTAFDVVLILKKGRHAVTGCEVSLQAERAEASQGCSPASISTFA